MRTAAEIRIAIASIESKLDSGVTKVTVDSTTTEYDTALLQKRLTQLYRELEAVDTSTKPRKPAVLRVDLGGF